jgi:predicted DNA-binding transcriptional regulator AlpA
MLFPTNMKSIPKQSQDAQLDDVRFIGARKAENWTASSRWTLWRWEREGKFPASIKLNGKRVWIESEIRAWIAQRIAER